MSNGYTNLNPNIVLEHNPVFSASFAAAKIAPVSALLISGLPDGEFELSFVIECKYKNETVFSTEEMKYHKLDGSMYDMDRAGRLCICFSYDDFSVSQNALRSILKSDSADIIARVNISGAEYDLKSSLILSAVNEWQGIELHPETLAAFVSLASKEAEIITEGLPKLSVWNGFSDACTTADEIIKRIRLNNIICAKRDGYSPEKKQLITPLDLMRSKSAVVATPVELALYFCSAALGCGLSPIVTFVKNNMGIVSLFCGFTCIRNGGFLINESMTKLRKNLDNSEMLLFDPAVLSSAQTMDIQRASHLASENLHKANTEMLLCINIAECLDSGIETVFGNGNIKNVHIKEPREALAEIYTGIVNGKVFKMLGGDYSAYDVVPILGFDVEKYEKALEKELVVRPLEISEKLAVYSGMCDNFAAFALKDVPEKKYNKAESVLVTEQYKAFVSRVRSKSHAVSGIYEKVFHERISRMTYGSVPGFENYLVCGFMRLTEKQSGETRYMPICFVKAELSCNYDYKLKLEKHNIIINTVLASYLSRHDILFSGVDSINGALDVFEKLAESARRSGDYSSVDVIKEYALIKTDFSEFALWNDIKLYGKSMLSNKNFASVLSGKKMEAEEEVTGKDFNFPRFVTQSVKNALLKDGNTVLYGKSVAEKTDAVINKAVYTVSCGQSVIVSAEDRNFLDEIHKGMEKEGFSDITLMLDSSLTVQKLSEMIQARLEDAKENASAPSAEISTEFDKQKTRMNEYQKALSQTDSSLGINVLDCALSYFRACDTPDGSDIPILPVEKRAFVDMSKQKFNNLFMLAQNLVEKASKVQEAAELGKSEPIKNNPLYPIKSSLELNEQTIHEIFDMVSKITGVISDYRETFYDISEYIGMDISDIKNLEGLYALNELYKLVISAREIEIPEGFAESNLTDFADNADVLRKDLNRAENIEYRLRFFGSEIFEDVDTLLTGYSSSDNGQGNFIRKFLVKKNNKDVLLQYVAPNKKSEFYSHDVDEIYSLLEEYRDLRRKISGADKALADKENVELAEFIKKAQDYLCKIYEGIGNNAEALTSKTAKLLSFINTVSNDASVSRKLTYARAKFAQVYSENECLISELSRMLGADFTVLYFENGILAYDGINSYFKALEKNIPSVSLWNAWLKAKNDAYEFIPAFSEYIEENGVKNSIDRIFAASLILPSVEYIAVKGGIPELKAIFENSKEKYIEMLDKAKALEVFNAIASYKRKLKHYSQTGNLLSLEEDSSLTLCEFVNKHTNLIFNVFPCVLVESKKAGSFFEGKCVADTVICAATHGSDVCMLTLLSLGNSMFLADYGNGESLISKLLSRSGACMTEMSYSIYPSCKKLLVPEGVSFYCANEYGCALSVIRVNGNMRRTSDSANPKEAESCVSKASEIYAKTGKRVGIFAVTGGQFAYISHLLSLFSESDKSLALGLENGFIKAVDASRPCFEKFDVVMLSLGAAVDTNGNIGWSFGLGGKAEADALTRAAFAAESELILVSSLTAKDLNKLRKSSVEAEKLYFVLSCASSSMIPMNAKDNLADNSNLTYMLMTENKELLSASGIYSCAAEGMDSEGVLYMYDCDISGNVYDKLYSAQRLKEAGVRFEILSPLDSVFKKLGL